MIEDADSVVALTGAGISVPSGIPDFRTPGTGLWANIDPMEVAHIDVFRRDPNASGISTAIDSRRSKLGSPTPPIARWRGSSDAGLLDAVITAEHRSPA